MPAPNGPYGVLVSWNEQNAADMEMPVPIVMQMPLLWGGLSDSKLWDPLPLTARLGFSLRYMRFEPAAFEFLPMPRFANQTLRLLSINVETASKTFGKPQVDADFDMILALADGKDLETKHVEVIEQFLRTELRPGDSIDEDENIDDAEEEVVDSPPESSARGDVNSDIMAEAQIEEIVARITPEKLAAFFEEYKTKNALASSEWGNVDNPIQPIACEACRKPEAEKGALMVCSACKVVKYCDKECQKQGCEAHKTICKAMRPRNKVFQARRFPSPSEAGAATYVDRYGSGEVQVLLRRSSSLAMP
ncbi:Putative Zinc finger, MYND-type [Septoria linicola]|uniref:Zinc finger, MYND-type n=1 Tax=Septoria linicola TaxID=215465 RepID=A0A9Q9ELN7_9PEZI|nr:putative Zinc finger, MYND-type [Septoria linicola]USW55260.1 Putative Zinc finger, MYND-type [Septoria linicola]